MNFYKEISHFLTNDRAIDNLHTYGTTEGPEVSPAGTPPGKEKAQGAPGTAGQLVALEQVIKAHRSRALLLVSASSQDMGTEMHFQHNPRH